MRKFTSLFVLITFLFSCITPPTGFAQVLSGPAALPEAGTMVTLSSAFNAASLMGMTIDTVDPLKFDFLIDKGQQALSDDDKKVEYNKLVKYFLAALTIPDKDQWVNLSPYEREGMIDGDFGSTEMGRDLLAQDYILKQLTASVIHPDSETGKQFWAKIYEKAYAAFGTTVIPVNTFNKVWILPDEAIVYEKDNAAYILKSHMKVMTERDYLSMKENTGNETIGTDQQTTDQMDQITAISDRIVREVLLPVLEKEVNEGKNFANLRQIYSAMVLATWYKKALKESLLGQVYANNSKVAGVDQDPENNEEIYDQYIEAFRTGVFNLVKKDFDNYSNDVVSRKYYSGGFSRQKEDKAQALRQAGFEPAEVENIREKLVAGNILDAAGRVSKPGLTERILRRALPSNFPREKVAQILDVLKAPASRAGTAADVKTVDGKKERLAPELRGPAQAKVDMAQSDQVDRASVTLKLPDITARPGGFDKPARLDQAVQEIEALPPSTSPTLWQRLNVSFLLSSLSDKERQELPRPVLERAQRVLPPSITRQEVVLPERDIVKFNGMLGQMKERFGDTPEGIQLANYFAARPADAQTMGEMQRILGATKRFDKTSVGQIGARLVASAGAEQGYTSTVAGRSDAEPKELATSARPRLVVGSILKPDIETGVGKVSLDEVLGMLESNGGIPDDVQTIYRDEGRPKPVATQVNDIIAANSSVTDRETLGKVFAASEFSKVTEKADLDTLISVRDQISSYEFSAPNAPTPAERVILTAALDKVDNEIFNRVSEIKKVAEVALKSVSVPRLSAGARAERIPVHPIEQAETPLQVAQVVDAQTQAQPLPWKDTYASGNSERVLLDVVSGSSDRVRARFAGMPAEDIQKVSERLKIERQETPQGPVVRLVAQDESGVPVRPIRETQQYAKVVQPIVEDIVTSGLRASKPVAWDKSYEDPVVAQQVIEKLVIGEIGGAAGDGYIAKDVSRQLVAVPERQPNGRVVVALQSAPVAQEARGVQEFQQTFPRSMSLPERVRLAAVKFFGPSQDTGDVLRLARTPEGPDTQMAISAALTGRVSVTAASRTAGELVDKAPGTKAEKYSRVMAMLLSGAAEPEQRASAEVRVNELMDQAVRQGLATTGNTERAARVAVGASLFDAQTPEQAVSRLKTFIDPTKDQDVQIEQAIALAAISNRPGAAMRTEQARQEFESRMAGMYGLGIDNEKDAARLVADQLVLKEKDTVLQRTARINISERERNAVAMTPVVEAAISSTPLSSGISFPEQKEILQTEARKAVRNSPQIRYLAFQGAQAKTPEDEQRVMEEIRKVGSLRPDEGKSIQEVLELTEAAVAKLIVAKNNLKRMEEVDRVNGTSRFTIVPQDDTQATGFSVNTPEHKKILLARDYLGAVATPEAMAIRANPSFERAFADALEKEGTNALTPEGRERVFVRASDDFLKRSVLNPGLERPEGVEQPDIVETPVTDLVRISDSLRSTGNMDRTRFSLALADYMDAEKRSVGTGERPDIQRTLSGIQGVPQEAMPALTEAVQAFARAPQNKRAEVARVIASQLPARQVLEKTTTRILAVSPEVDPQATEPQYVLVVKPEERRGEFVPVTLFRKGETPEQPDVEIKSGWLPRERVAQIDLDDVARNTFSADQDEADRAFEQFKTGIAELRENIMPERPEGMTTAPAVARALKTGGLPEVMRTVRDNGDKIAAYAEGMEKPTIVLNTAGEEIALPEPEQMAREGGRVFLVRASAPDNQGEVRPVSVYVTKTDRVKALDGIESSQNSLTELFDQMGRMGLVATEMGTQAGREAARAAAQERPVLYVRSDGSSERLTVESVDRVLGPLTRVIALQSASQSDNPFVPAEAGQAPTVVVVDSDYARYAFGLEGAIAPRQPTRIAVNRLSAAQERVRQLPEIPDVDIDVDKGAPIRLPSGSDRTAFSALFEAGARTNYDGVTLAVRYGNDGEITLVPTDKNISRERFKVAVAGVIDRAKNIDVKTLGRSTSGGIDFAIDQLNMQIQRDENGVPLPLPMQNLESLGNINGFTPEIMSIDPVKTLPILSEAVSASSGS